MPENGPGEYWDDRDGQKIEKVRELAREREKKSTERHSIMEKENVSESVSDCDRVQ